MKHLLALSLLFAIGCTSSPPPYDPDAHSSEFPTCDAIIDRCHPFDVGKGPIHDCHELGHGATSDDVCIQKKDECFKLCTASDAGPDGSDAASDAPSDVQAEQ